MERINLWCLLALFLMPDARRQGQLSCKGRLKRLIAFDPASNVADQPAEAGTQEFYLPAVALKLFRMGISPSHDQRFLAHAHITLAQRDGVLFASFTSRIIDRYKSLASVGKVIAFG